MDPPGRVLFVDDDAAMCDAATAIRRESNALEALTTDGGTDDLHETITEDDVECVVAGHSPPDVDGLELLRRIREPFPDLPVVMFTESGSESVASEAIAAGVTDYVRRDDDETYAVLANRIESAIGRRRAERELETERRRYELLGRATGDAYWDWDLETDRVERSTGYAHTYGFDPDEIEETIDWWIDRVHPEDEEKISRVANRAMERGDERYQVDYRVRTGDGSYKPVRTHAYVIYEDGDPTRIVGAVTDISNLVRQNERLEEFASIVSHDLRSPLTVLDGALELAETTGDPEHFERANRAIDRMQQLIDDLLELAREGQSIDERVTVDLPKTARHAWGMVATADATLTIATDPPNLLADESRLRQLFENLFRNTIQHGGDDVTVTVGELSDGDGFYVADDGPGIPAEHRDRVFDVGYSASANGTGYGLAIVREIAAAHGWDVTATESADGGVRFEVRNVDVAGGGDVAAGT